MLLIISAAISAIAVPYFFRYNFKTLLIRISLHLKTHIYFYFFCIFLLNLRKYSYKRKSIHLHIKQYLGLKLPLSEWNIPLSFHLIYWKKILELKFIIVFKEKTFTLRRTNRKNLLIYFLFCISFNNTSSLKLKIKAYFHKKG